MQNTEVTRRKVPISDLKPHPRQREVFTRPTPAEIELLANDMRDRGLQHPIEILPDNTIICGHRRVLAAQYLDWVEIDAIIRHDLADAGDLQIERHLISDNVLRRQLGVMDQARCAYRLQTIYRGGDLNQLSYDDVLDVDMHTRDWVGRMMNISGRQVSRLLALTEAPLAVQEACQDGRLPMHLGEKIANLSEPKKQQVAAEIESGVDPETAARKYVSGRPRKSKEDLVFTRLVGAIQDATRAYRDGFAQVRIADAKAKDPASLLRESLPMLTALAEHVEQRRREQEEALAAKLDEMVDLVSDEA